MRREISAEQDGMLARWARFAVRRRGTVLLGWLAALVVVIALGGAFGGSFENAFKLPGTESQRAFDLLSERFPQRAGDTAELVFKAESGVAAPETRARI